MANVRLSWNPNPVNQLVHSYRVWEQVDNGFWNVIATVAEPTVVVAASGGVRKYKVQAQNFVGDSPESEVLTGPGVPTAPDGLTLTVE